jgi:hypothetical protein
MTKKLEKRSFKQLTDHFFSLILILIIICYNNIIFKSLKRKSQ